ncbi:MAG TPA: SDR family NAD(P)-dependent oxidoreductase, partial [Longimicrobiaceae bacterium]|nr:SDR family NAD(P)-dependent oxidoreductase [Longimicrobiaceae bacterium]
MRERDYTLITGGAGFIGSNLADALLSDGERVVILDNLSRDGVKSNVQWLTAKHGSQVRLELGDVTDAKRVSALVKGASKVFHLAAQVAVTTSLDDPAHDLQTNL